MKITCKAMAGTLESSDVLVQVEPAESGLTIDLQSAVAAQFGDAIKLTAAAVAKELGVNNAHLVLTDKGALDCTIRARVETALKRALAKAGQT